MNQGLFGAYLLHSILWLLARSLCWHVPVHNQPPSRDLCSSETAEVALEYLRIHVWAGFRMTNMWNGSDRRVKHDYVLGANGRS